MSLSPEFLDDLRTRTGLAAVVGRRVKLSRAGREWKGCCPFHNEKSPSFYVNEEKGFYHCFGCGAHGDAIRFLMEQDGLTFIDAVKQLAAEAGMELPAFEPRGPEAERRATLHEILAAAANWFAGQLHSAGAADARHYLERRGVSAAQQQMFGLGFAPDSNSALSAALRNLFPDITPDMLLAAGLQGQSDSGRRYDRFRGRLIFPIHDARGRAVGFGGRILGPGEPKYLNSADGPLFAKGRLLYNLHRAAAAARKSGRLLIVEGYMDVVGLSHAGIAEAVAPLGTALTEEQLGLAWRLVDEPILAFDGDSAGLRAGERAAMRALPLLKAGKSLRFLQLPQGKDPDDIARQGGKGMIETLLAGARSLEAFLFDTAAASASLDTPERRAALREKLMETAATITDPALRRDYRRSWGRRFDALVAPNPGRAPFRPAAHGAGRKAMFAPPPLRHETRGAGDANERILVMILASFALRPDAVIRHAEALAALPINMPAAGRIRDALLDGQPVNTLAQEHRALWASTLSDEEFDRRAGDALASLIELHHIDVAMEQPPRECVNDEQWAREQQRRSLLGHARVKAVQRLVAHVVNEGDT